jgi:phytoene synthase
MDVRGTTYTTFDELEHYCRCVAGSIGRLCLGVFAPPDPEPAAPLADALGIALQLTNILRDVVEDDQRGRTYLPKEDLASFGVLKIEHNDDPLFAALIRFEAARADQWYRTGLGVLAHLDRRSAACTAAMSGIYRGLLHRIAARPERVLTGRVRLPGWHKAAVAARALTVGR